MKDAKVIILYFTLNILILIFWLFKGQFHSLSVSHISYYLFSFRSLSLTRCILFSFSDLIIKNTFLYDIYLSIWREKTKERDSYVSKFGKLVILQAFIFIAIYRLSFLYRYNSIYLYFLSDLRHLPDWYIYIYIYIYVYIYSIQFEIICIALFTIQSLQSSFTGILKSLQ